MRTSKKVLAMLLSACLVLSLTAVGIAAYADNAVFANPGTYTASAAGKNGDVTVTAEFSEDAIVAIEYSGVETPEIGNAAIETLIDQVIANQTLNVDAVSGATLSSAAFLTALTETVEQAGGNLDALSAVVNEEQTVDYVTEADVIVVGAGGAGLTAAMSALEKGASVILLEKSSFVGGNTLAAMSGINVANSQIQKDAGIEYSVEDFVEMQTNELARVNLITHLAERSAETVDWLVSIGADLAPNASKEFQVVTTEPGAYTTVKLVETLENALEATDIQLYLNMEATALVTDEENRVVGVLATNAKGEEITFSAKSVVLATGGFGKDHERVETLVPAYKYVTTDEIAPTTGDGIDMAVAIGAKTVDMEQIMLHSSVGVGIGMVATGNLPGGKDIKAIVVNLNGERFGSDGNLKPLSSAIFEQPEGTGVMVFNQEYLSDFLKHYYDLGIVVSGETAAELAEKLGIDPDTLQATVDKWNEDVANGVDTLFGRESNLIPLEGTLCAFKYNPGVHYCMGGILINEDAQVLDMQEAPIVGLYAGGEVTGGVHGNTRVDGSAVTDTFVFGRIAGQNAADFALQ